MAKTKGSKNASAAARFLVQVVALRQSAEYQAAERTRRQVGTLAMAQSPSSSIEYAQIRFLVDTWEWIARGTGMPDFPWDSFFVQNPLLYVWDNLDAAIRVFRKTEANYAGALEDVVGKYKQWLLKQPKKYRGAATTGVHALFG